MLAVDAARFSCSGLYGHDVYPKIFAEVIMVLPDWTTALNAQFTAWLGWSTLTTIVSVTVGAAVILIVAGMLLRIFIYR